MGYIEKHFGGPYPFWIITDRGFEYLRKMGVTDRNISLLRDKRDSLVGDHYKRRVKGRREAIIVTLPSVRRTIALILFGLGATAAMADTIGPAPSIDTYVTHRPRVPLHDFATKPKHRNHPSYRRGADEDEIELSKRPRLKTLLPFRGIRTV
jgi:hypothetical protein